VEYISVSATGLRTRAVPCCSEEVEHTAHRAVVDRLKQNQASRTRKAIAAQYNSGAQDTRLGREQYHYEGSNVLSIDRRRGDDCWV
jgi:hypothetical protein